MKSRNLKAIFASVLTVALLATAMTGFAATVTTTSKYNTGNDRVAVTTSVSDATADSEVTYLVKNNAGDIVYIDQKTAVNGAVSFDYKIAQSKVADFATTVKFGTDSTDTFTGTGAESLGFVALQTQDTETYTVTYENDVVAAGIGETVTANIAAKDGYEIVDVKVNEESKGAVASVVVDNDDVITVTTAAVEVEAAIQVFTTSDAAENSYVAVIQKVGNPYEVGVKFDGELYPSIDGDNLVAVKLVLPAEIAVDSVEFAPYFIAEEGGVADTTSSVIE